MLADAARNHQVNLDDPPIEVLDSDNDVLSERVIEGLKIAVAYADRLEDPEYAAAVMDKLLRSNVRGSRVDNVRSLEDVCDMLGSVNDWKVVPSNLSEKQITCLQGTLPSRYANYAYAAYASIRDLARKYGPNGLETIAVKTGNQNSDEYYLCTTCRYPTSTITVQLRESPQKDFEFLHQWFAGPELSSMLRMDDGDTIVRCGVIIPYIDRKPNGTTNHKKGYKPSRNS